MNNSLLTHTFTEDFITENGDCISALTVGYQTWGSLNVRRDNAVVVCHALTGNTQADGWFGDFFGAGNVLDPTRDFIICANVLGSCYGSSGPASINGTTGELYRADFPVISVRDTVCMIQKLLDMLEINEVRQVIGGSLGGMQALELSVMDDRVQSAICIAMGKAHSPWTIGISHTQRQAIFNDPNWNNGYYSKDQPPKEGLALARMIAMNSYRTPCDFDTKFARKPQPNSSLFQVESYLNYQGEKLANRFDAVAYVRLTQMMDMHDVARNRGSYSSVLGNLRIPVLVIGINSDGLYPVYEQQELANLLPNGRYAEINSPYGHDAFLIEFDQMRAFISSFSTHSKIFN